MGAEGRKPRYRALCQCEVEGIMWMERLRECRLYSRDVSVSGSDSMMSHSMLK
jgi:hypothetical protein